MGDKKAIRRTWETLFSAALVLVLAVPADAATVRGTDGTFTPHRALYDMTLRTAEPGSSVADASGTMYYRFEALCEGWEVESRVALRLHYGNVGSMEVVETTWTFTSFESYDGSHLTYAVDHKRNGMLQEAFAGEAGKDGSGGGASFNDDVMTSVDLPSGTLFPAEHLKRMLDHAKRQDGAFKRVVFDGASTDNPYEVNAYVLGPVGARNVAARAPESRAKPVLVGAGPASGETRTYRIRMAYFPLFAASTMPEFEIEVDYRTDGIAERMIQDFGDFSLDLTPSRLEMLPVSGCE
jgi:hypothetical protein